MHVVTTNVAGQVVTPVLVSAREGAEPGGAEREVAVPVAA